MAKKVKDKLLVARADETLNTKVTEYIEVAELTMGELVRAAVEEFMLNHPVKRPTAPLVDKPGTQATH